MSTAPLIRFHRVTTGVVMASAFAAIACASLPGRARAETWLPLDIGNRWSYQGVAGGHEVTSITGTTVLRDRMVYVRSYLESPQNAGLENYWSVEPDGDVFLHGFMRRVENFGVAYEPPLRMLDAPLSLGRAWTTTSTVYYLPDMSLNGSYDFSFQVMEDGVLSLPAGTFDAMGIGQTAAPPLGRTGIAGQLAPDGARRSTALTAQEWYAQGVGEVQYATDDLYQLAVADLPTPVVATSWGRIKRLYH